MNITIDNRPNYVSRFYAGQLDGQRFMVHVVDDRISSDPDSKWNPGSITIQWINEPGEYNTPHNTSAVYKWLQENAYLAAPEGLVLMVKASEWNREDM